MGARLAFPPFTFDREERVLRRDGTTVPLPPKVAEALDALLTVPGALVGKDALRDRLWPDGFVEDGNLTQTIYLIRRALDPEGDGRGFVETITRRGYRFVPPVRVLPEPLAVPRSAAARAVFALRTVAAALAIAVFSGGISIGRSPAPVRAELSGDAARAYAVGRYNWNRRTESAVRTAIADFRRVAALAPNDARGYAGLADAYVTVADWEYARIARRADAFHIAEGYARDALRRDPRSGEAMTTLGRIALNRDHDLDRSERMLHAAIALSPNHGPAYEILGVARLYRGDADGGRRALRRATELDPLSPIDLLWYGKSLYFAKQYGDARAAFRQVLELDAQMKEARVMLSQTELELGLFDDARRSLAALRLPPEKQRYKAILTAFTEMRSGHTPRTLPDLRPGGDPHVDTVTASALCLGLGRRADALAWLELNVRNPGERLARKMLALDPRLTGLRDEARFRAISS
jgi:DNA-binding winged helix-turn-helix (wHTH) protein/cytochrome c-type biogenesis protein CcmH/NrfG